MSATELWDRPVHWEPVPDRVWQPTVRSLHRWSQVIGKIRLALAEPLPHWWHAALYVSPAGLTTSPIPYRRGMIELELDLRHDELDLQASDGRRWSLPLRPMSVAEFYRATLALLASADVGVRIRPVPVEVVDAIPFAEDTAPGGYEPDHARALHGALMQAHRVLTRFRAGYVGKASPVHFFWGSFDLAMTRFSGRPAPPHPGGVPNCPDWVMQEAYSHEVSSAGWWPGTEGSSIGAAFYAYMYPEPPGYREASIRPAGGAYDADIGEFVLPYNEAAGTDDPDATVESFLRATYDVGAALAGWERAVLERATQPGLVHSAPDDQRVVSRASR
jgi:hypothetical protein